MCIRGNCIEKCNEEYPHPNFKTNSLYNATEQQLDYDTLTQTLMCSYRTNTNEKSPLIHKED